MNDPRDLLSQWKLLDMVDPDEAQRWHWKDGRKVKRGIERWWERLAAGVPEHAEAESSTTKPKLKGRFRTLIFWVYDTMDNLRPRLDKRVDRMVEVGHAATVDGTENDTERIATRDTRLAGGR